MIRGYHHHISGASEISAILVWRSTRPDCESAPVAVKHDRTLASIGRGSPDVQKQAILAGHGLARPERGPFGLLHSRDAEFHRIAHASPRLKRRRSLESV